ENALNASAPKPMPAHGRGSGMPRITSPLARRTVIPSTLDARLQRIVDQRIAESLRRGETLGLKNAAAILVDWRTMEVRASAGSADFFNVEIQGQIDGTRMMRSPGSALKPFIYALALDAGLIHPLTLLNDAPASFTGYNPENFDRDFCGPIHARDALTQSRNVPAVELEARLVRLRDEAEAQARAAAAPSDNASAMSTATSRGPARPSRIPFTATHVSSGKRNSLAGAATDISAPYRFPFSTSASASAAERPRTLYELLRTAQVAGLKPELHYGLAIALGAEEVSIRDMARLYGMMAGGGLLRELKDRTDLPQTLPNHAPRTLSPEACFLTLDMLATAKPPDSAQSFAPRGAEDPRAIAWKTGTSFSFRDAWTAGVFDNYVLIVWVGNFDSRQNSALAGRVAAAPLFFSIIDGVRTSGIDKYIPPPVSVLPPASDSTGGTSDVSETAHVPQQAALSLPAGPATPTAAASQGSPGSPIHDWHSPEGLNLTRVPLCAVSGDIACPHCPRTVQGWFVPGLSPISACTVHQLVWIDPATGLRVPAADSVPGARQHVIEVWASDVRQLFARAGMPRRDAPPWAPGFEPKAGETSAAAAAIAIVSPQPGLQYRMITGGTPPRVPLQAASSGNTRRIDWFKGTEPLGSSRPDEVLLWTAPPGLHEITAVTDDGAVSSVSITVSVASP
ncbi:MAG: penicillin-binding transpeptidase domain-containing protein, partial [Candidatus Methylacidiphilales bacterium]